ncbi:MAG: hypothetical protein ACKV2Q_11580 [Planctomycetaceae bacterium]
MTVRTNDTKPVGNPSSAFAKLTTKDLADNATLLDWFNAAVRRKNPVVRDTETDRLNVFAAAERALEVGTNPVALFAHIVGEHKWQLISCEQEDRARRRLHSLRKAQLNQRHPSNPQSFADLVSSICHKL